MVNAGIATRPRCAIRIQRERHIAAGRHPVQVLRENQHQQRRRVRTPARRARMLTSAAPRSSIRPRGPQPTPTSAPGMPSAAAMIAAATMSSSVRGRRVAISPPTGVPSCNDRPRSPTSRWPKLLKYCVKSGRSRPSCLCNSATAAGSGRNTTLRQQQLRRIARHKPDGKEHDRRHDPDGDKRGNNSPQMPRHQTHTTFLGDRAGLSPRRPRPLPKFHRSAFHGNVHLLQCGDAEFHNDIMLPPSIARNTIHRTFSNLHVSCKRGEWHRAGRWSAQPVLVSSIVVPE